MTRGSSVEQIMFEESGYWWPRIPMHDGMVAEYLRSTEDTALALSHLKKFDVAVQAGGHCGEWANRLALKFGAVYTFEPDAWNFNCLSRNIAGRGNIYAARGFLGDVRGTISLERKLYSLGGSHHGVSSAVGQIPVYRIDDLNLVACDALFLDVEGMEYPALKGAKDTIQKFSPVIQIENYAEYAERGWGCYADIQALLPGYVEVGRIHYDIVLAKR